MNLSFTQPPRTTVAKLVKKPQNQIVPALRRFASKSWPILTRGTAMQPPNPTIRMGKSQRTRRLRKKTTATNQTRTINLPTRTTSPTLPKRRMAKRSQILKNKKATSKKTTNKKTRRGASKTKTTRRKSPREVDLDKASRVQPVNLRNQRVQIKQRVREIKKATVKAKAQNQIRLRALLIPPRLTQEKTRTRAIRQMVPKADPRRGLKKEVQKVASLRPIAKKRIGTSPRMPQKLLSK